MKKSLIIALALMLVLAFATSAMAAQVIFFPNELSTKDATYDWTTHTYIYNFSTPTTHEQTGLLSGYDQYTKFKADGKSNYPYEIYLPNEINPAQYRIHTSYTKNTDACASCHATHTAVNGMLLQWYSAYETCMACHDGTVTTTYNVVTGEVGTAKSLAPGGMFGTGDEASLSSHNVTGAVEIAAAPGAGIVEDSKGKWTPEFGCESCHSPHGNGGNARILEPNPNGYATKLAIAKNIGGTFTYIKGSTFYDKKDGNVVTTPAGMKANVSDKISATDKVYINNVYLNTTVVDKAYFIITPETKLQKAVDGAGSAYTFLKPGRESGFAIKVGTTVEPWDSASYGPKDWIIDNSTGVTRAIYKGTNARDFSAGVYFVGIPTVKVTMDIDNYLSQTGQEVVIHGSGMNNFCGACHLDYNTASQEVYDLRNDGKIGGAYAFDTGVYSKAHRHTVGTLRSVTPTTNVLDYEWASGKAGYDTKFASSNAAQGTFTCLTCHVAHGTSYDYWNRLLVGTSPKVGPSGDAWTSGELVELAGSSALKRLPNMGTCETCHNKENGQDGYMANSSIGTSLTDGNDPKKGIDNALFSQKTSQFVGMENTNSSCAKCHEAAVEEWIETQHNMFAPYNNAVAGGYLQPFDGEKGNATAEQIALLDELYTAAQAVNQTVSGVSYTGLVNIVKADILNHSAGTTAGTAVGDAAYQNAYNNALSAKDFFSVGQLPVGTRKGMEAVREFIVRYQNDTGDAGAPQYEYAVVGAAKYEPNAGEWEIEKFVPTAGKVTTSHGKTVLHANDYFALEAIDNYTGSCFNCHASLTTMDTSLDKVAGTGSNADKLDNRNLLNSWYNYLYAGADKPARDLGISCEACHGAAKNHTLAPSALNIFNPANADLKSQSRVCGRCHVSSGNKNGFYAYYQPWKLVSNELITPGSVRDIYFDSTYVRFSDGVANPNAINPANNQTYSYNTYATQMDAFFRAGWESFGPGSNVLPAADTTSNSGGEWTYKSKEGRNWFSGGHTQYTTLATSKHFSPDFAPGVSQVSCSSCHDSHGGAQTKYQLNAAGPAATCATCHGADIVPSKFMPVQSSNEVVMHDFGRLFNEATERPVNTKYTDPTTFPRWE